MCACAIIDMNDFHTDLRTVIVESFNVDMLDDCEPCIDIGWMIIDKFSSYQGGFGSKGPAARLDGREKVANGQIRNNDHMIAQSSGGRMFGLACDETNKFVAGIRGIFAQVIIDDMLEETPSSLVGSLGAVRSIPFNNSP